MKTPERVERKRGERQEVRFNAAGALGAIGPEAKAALPALAGAARDRSGKVRVYALWAAWRNGQDIKGSIQVLVDAMKAQIPAGTVN